MRRFLLAVVASVLFISASIEAKIYDCFLFFNELDLLEVRLAELYDHVDQFVLVESIETFRGNLKPLYFKENEERYLPYLDKIIHVVVDKRLNVSSPWDRERYQRDQILTGLKGCADDDIILVSDVDEIPRVSAIKTITEILSSKKNKNKRLVCDQKLYRYFLNAWDSTTRKEYHCTWPGTYAMAYHRFKRCSADALRLQRDGFNHIENGGWHFTSMGGHQAHVIKLSSFSHSERDIPENKDPQVTKDYLERNCKLVPIDESYPKYIQTHLAYFQEIGFIAE